MKWIERNGNVMNSPTKPTQKIPTKKNVWKCGKLIRCVCKEWKKKHSKMECDCLTFRREKLFPCEWWCKWRNIEKEEKTSGESTLKWQWKIARITLNKFEIYANGIRCWLLEQVEKKHHKMWIQFPFRFNGEENKNWLSFVPLFGGNTSKMLIRCVASLFFG